MPFTPFHMGAALALKPAARERFSVLTFGLAQIAMDLEPLLGMLNGWDTLHGWTHTLLGAAVIAIVVALAAPLFVGPISGLLNRWAAESRTQWLLDPHTSRAAIWAGALMGTFSHVLLDALIHHDMHPFAPLSQANPLIGLIEHDSVYGLCALMGAAGAAVWIVLRWRGRRAAATR